MDPPQQPFIIVLHDALQSHDNLQKGVSFDAYFTG